MDAKRLLMEQIEREQEFCLDCEVGSEEYVNSTYRLLDLEKALAEVEKNEAEAERKERELAEAHSSRHTCDIREWVKVGTNILLPLIGLKVILAFEKDDSFTTSLRGIVNCFIPKRM